MGEHAPSPLAMLRCGCSVSPRARALVGGFMLAFVTWQLWRWLPSWSGITDEAWFAPLGVAAVVASWRASLRTRGARGLCHAWRLLALAETAYMLGLAAAAAYQLVAGALPYPSLSDLCELAFYPLACAGLLMFPARRAVRSAQLLYLLDLAVVAIGCGALAWYLVIEPYVVHDGHTLLTELTTIAYPAGDGLLVIALVSRVLRGTRSESRNSLVLVCGGVAFFVVADLIWEYLSARGAFQLGGAVDDLWLLAQALMVFAAVAQCPAGLAEERPARSAGEAGWLPYAAVLLGLSLLFISEIGDSLASMSLVLVVIALAVLLVVRQFLMARLRRRQDRQLEVVATLGRQGLECRDLREFLQAGARCVAGELGVEYVSVLALEPEQGRLRMVAATGWPSGSVDHVVVPLTDASQAGATMLRDGPVVVGDLRERGRFPGVVGLRELGVVSGATTPIRTGHGHFGVLAAHTTRPRRFSAEEVAFLDTVAGVLGAAAERAQADDEIRHHAMYDWLTGLPNRLLFGDRLTQALASSRRGTEMLALLFMDLDHFKNINDSLGHGAGDEVLRRLTARLASLVRPDDTLARLGGDEFAVLLPRIGRSADAEEVAARLLGALAAPITLEDGRAIVIGASIGIAYGTPAEALSAGELERNADLAMYAAKGAGRGQIRSFEPGMHEDAMRRLELTGDLRGSVHRREFELHYQPIVSLAEGGRLVGAEALVRWNHPTHGLLSPAAFIELAEETGMIVPIGRFVLAEATGQLARWQSRRPQLAISVNVSAAQLRHEGLVADVAAALAVAGIRPASLILEITETVLMGGNGIHDQLAKLHELGVRLAIDDFGTGYSSLSYLHEYPFDILKIDRSFVAGLGGSTSGDQLVRGIVSLAHCLELEAIAEGVERPDQATALAAMSAGLAQGFHYGRPLSAPDFERRLLAGHAVAA